MVCYLVMHHSFKIGFFVLVVITILSYQTNDFSSASLPTVADQKTYQIEVAEVVVPTSFLVFDVETGEVLFENRAKEVVPIASVTKLFTATALLRTNLNATTTITIEDVWAEEDFGKLKAGEEYVARELLFPLLLESSNDVAKHFERLTEGQIIKDMNSLASEVGLPDTVLYDASGLSEKNVSTASDLAHFLSYLYQKESRVLDITTLRQYVGPYTGWLNNNPVLDKDYIGGKHGFTESAKRTGAVLFAENISGVSKKIGYVVLGSENLVEDVTFLRDFVHKNVRFE